MIATDAFEDAPTLHGAMLDQRAELEEQLVTIERYAAALLVALHRLPGLLGNLGQPNVWAQASIVLRRANRACAEIAERYERCEYAAESALHDALTPSIVLCLLQRAGIHVSPEALCDVELADLVDIAEWCVHQGDEPAALRGLRGEG